MDLEKYASEFLKLALEVGYGKDGRDLTWQKDFDKTTECVKCGKKARLAIVIKEDGKEKQFISQLHKNDPDDKGFWLHDSASFAIYLCSDLDCATATTIWNQA